MSSQSSEGSTSLTLLQRARANDRDAWRRLVRLYAPLVSYWCRRAGVADQDLPDIGQEVFQAVSRAIATFQPASFRGWLRTITLNKVRDQYRRNEHFQAAVGGIEHQEWLSQQPADDSEGSDEERTTLDAILCRQAMELVQPDFEDRTWRAFWLTTVEEHPAGEVGEQLGMTAMAVRKAKSRVMRRLRQEFGDLITQFGQAGHRLNGSF